jgi:hypothetical protein
MPKNQCDLHGAAQGAVLDLFEGLMGRAALLDQSHMWHLQLAGQGGVLCGQSACHLLVTLHLRHQRQGVFFVPGWAGCRAAGLWAARLLHLAASCVAWHVGAQWRHSNTCRRCGLTYVESYV